MHISSCDHLEGHEMVRTTSNSHWTTTTGVARYCCLFQLHWLTQPAAGTRKITKNVFYLEIMNMGNAVLQQYLHMQRFTASNERSQGPGLAGKKTRSLYWQGLSNDKTSKLGKDSKNKFCREYVRKTQWDCKKITISKTHNYIWKNYFSLFCMFFSMFSFI